VKQGAITNELVKGTSDFHNLFERPEHAAVLAGSRYAQGARELHGAQSSASTEPFAASEASTAASKTLAPHLASAARRLEAVRQTRNAGRRSGVSAATEAAEGAKSLADLDKALGM
jgi:hypothetical protein